MEGRWDGGRLSALGSRLSAGLAGAGAPRPLDEADEHAAHGAELPLKSVEFLPSE
jgi:hypothetical protein